MKKRKHAHQGHLQQQHQRRQQGLDRSGAFWRPDCGPFCGGVEIGAFPLELGDAAVLALLVLVPRSLHPVAVTVTAATAEPAPLWGPTTPALLSVTRSVTLQDIWNGENCGQRELLPQRSFRVAAAKISH